MPLFKFLLEKIALIFWFLVAGLFVSSLFGGPLPFFKLIVNIVLLVVGYWGGFAVITPFFEKIFKNLKWNWDFGIALVALIWLWIFFSFVGIFSQTEIGQWLGDLS